MKKRLIKPKRVETVTLKYYDFIEVGWIELEGRNGEPVGQQKNVVAVFIDSKDIDAKIEDLTNEFSINLVDYNNDLSTGFYVRKYESSRDAEKIIECEDESLLAVRTAFKEYRDKRDKEAAELQEAFKMCSEELDRIREEAENHVLTDEEIKDYNLNYRGINPDLDREFDEHVRKQKNKNNFEEDI